MENRNGLFFQRTEKKYLLTKEQADSLLFACREHTTQDVYGKYTICNIYFDTDDFSLIRYSLEKPAFKQKLRLRSYGIPTADQKVFLELKKKYKGVVYKRRIKQSYQDVTNYLNFGVIPALSEEERRTMAEIDRFRKTNRLRAKVYLAYDRIALVDKENENFRITMDSDLRSRFDRVSFEEGDFGDLYFEKDEKIMEIKIPDSVPIWFVRLLDELNIYPVSFSKYGRVYEKNRRRTLSL